QGRRAVGEAARRELMAPAARLRPRRWSLFGVVSEERYELEQAWAALADRERLLNETLARRSAEIDARARRYEEIGADLDGRRRPGRGAPLDGGAGGRGPPARGARHARGGGAPRPAGADRASRYRDGAAARASPRARCARERAARARRGAGGTKRVARGGERG